MFLQGNREVLDGDAQKALTINKAVQVLQKMEALACGSEEFSSKQQDSGLFI